MNRPESLLGTTGKALAVAAFFGACGQAAPNQAEGQENSALSAPAQKKAAPAPEEVVPDPVVEATAEIERLVDMIFAGEVSDEAESIGYLSVNPITGKYDRPSMFSFVDPSLCEFPEEDANAFILEDGLLEEERPGTFPAPASYIMRAIASRRCPDTEGYNPVLDEDLEVEGIGSPRYGKLRALYARLMAILNLFVDPAEQDRQKRESIRPCGIAAEPLTSVNLGEIVFRQGSL